MSNDLLQLDEWMLSFIAKLDGPARQQLARNVGRELRKLQGQNIKGQRSADGQAWAKRKRIKKPVAPIRTVYRKKDGTVREVELSGWRDNGGSITGHDKEAGGRRTILKVGMLRSLPARHGPAPGAMRRAQRMMQRMAAPGSLTMHTTGEGVELGFTSRAERIAAVHHFGLRDKVRTGGPEHDYTARRLLGIGDKERRAILEMVDQHLS